MPMALNLLNLILKLLGDGRLLGLKRHDQHLLLSHLVAEHLLDFVFLTEYPLDDNLQLSNSLAFL